MRFANRFFFLVALCALASACKSGDDDSGSNTGSGGTGVTGSGGMVATGAGGMVATGAGGMAATGTGGMVATGTGGMAAKGTGGMGTAGTGTGTGGMGVAGQGAGTGGMGTGGTGTGGTGSGSGGMGGGDMCVSDVMAASTTSTTAMCASCLCTMCNAEVTAMKGDTKAQALLDCGTKNNCSGNCCFCGMACDSLGSNYGMGPCAKETADAAGVTSTTDLSMASTLMTACGMAGSSCNKPQVLADCTMKNCATACPPVTVCPAAM